MPNYNGADDLSAERTELGTNDYGLAAFGKMATNFEIFRMFPNVDGCGQIYFVQACRPNGLA